MALRRKASSDPLSNLADHWQAALRAPSVTSLHGKVSDDCKATIQAIGPESMNLTHGERPIFGE